MVVSNYMFSNKVQKTNFLYFLLLLAYIKPHFYYYSYVLARFSDLITVIILLSIVLNNWGLFKLNRRVFKYIYINILYLLVILVSLFYASMRQVVVIQDFTDIIRPIINITSILVGYILYIKKFNRKRFLDFLILLGVLSSIVVFLEKAGMNIFYKLYSDQNHELYNRATGIYYDFAELGVLHAMAIISSIIRFTEERKKRYLLYILILVISILLSTSKASILLLVLLFFMLFIDTLFFCRRISIGSLSVIVIFSILFFYAMYIVISNIPALYDGLESVFLISEGNPSISNRLDDISYVSKVILAENVHLFIGFSASRTIDNSYIEIAFFSTLFRYGILGVSVYYSMFILILFEKLTDIYRYFKYLVFSTLLLDFVAAMTNRFSYPITIFMLIGILLTSEYFEKRKTDKS